MKWFGALLSVIGTGYVLDYGFKAMNMPDDLFYVGGMIGIFIWFVIMYLIWVGDFFKRRKHEASIAGSDSVGSNSTDSGLHNENRAGNGGN